MRANTCHKSSKSKKLKPKSAKVAAEKKEEKEIVEVPPVKQVIHGNGLAKLGKPATAPINVKHREIGNHHIHHPRPSQRQGATVQQFGLAILGDMVGDDGHARPPQQWRDFGPCPGNQPRSDPHLIAARAKVNANRFTCDGLAVHLTLPKHRRAWKWRR